MTKQITAERKTAYYLGLVLMVIGGFLFFSIFITGVMHFGNFDNFEANPRSSMFLVFGGMAFLVLGGIISGIGVRGRADSGVVLALENARQELEPFSRIDGGIDKDALDELDINLGCKPPRVIMIKCAGCGKLQDEFSEFCKACGKKM
ncbi:MAG: hypothetical protein WCJ02_01495 [bacterium]